MRPGLRSPRSLRLSTFTYHGRELNRFDHLYNSTAISERGVEVAVAVDFLAWRSRQHVLEVGNVLKHYEPDIDVPRRRVVDLYEHGWGVDNIDVFDIEGEYESIVSISTLEHVGFDYEPKQPDGPVRAIEHLRTLLTDDGRLLVTIPVGFNTDLDPQLALLETVRQTRLYRDPRKGGWASHWSEIPEWGKIKTYGYHTPWACEVWIGEFNRGD